MLNRRFRALTQAVGAATILLLAIYGLLALAGSGLPAARAQGAPQAVGATFSYQGVLRNPGGSLATGSYAMTARIYDAPVSGNQLYEQTFADVPVTSGVFNLLLDGAGLDTALSSMDRYIAITVAGSTEQFPRQKLHAVPWALRAGRADTADTLGPNATVSGLKVADGLSLTGDLKVTGNLSVTGSLENLRVSHVSSHQGWDNTGQLIAIGGTHNVCFVSATSINADKWGGGCDLLRDTPNETKQRYQLFIRYANCSVTCLSW